MPLVKITQSDANIYINTQNITTIEVKPSRTYGFFLIVKFVGGDRLELTSKNPSEIMDKLDG